MAIRQIRADGTGDFTTIAAWLASLPATLTEDEIAEITGTINATGAATNFQVVTSPTARVIIRAAAGQETTYRSGDGKARIDFGAFDFVINSTSSKHVTIENVALYLGVGSSSKGIIMESSGAPSGADWQFRNLFIAKGGTNNAMGISRPFPGLVIENCIIFGLGGATNTGVVLRGSSLIAGFTPVDLGLSSADTGTVERCYFANNAYAFGQLFSADSSADLGFSDTNSDRGISGTVVTNAALLDQYTDPANGDWSFKAGNALQGAGTAGADIGFIVPGGASVPGILSGQGQLVPGRMVARGTAGLAVGATGSGRLRLQLLALAGLSATGFASFVPGAMQLAGNAKLASLALARLALRLLRSAGQVRLKIAGTMRATSPALRSGSLNQDPGLTAATGRIEKGQPDTRRQAVDADSRRIEVPDQGRLFHV